jgi:hypothetical protein
MMKALLVLPETEGALWRAHFIDRPFLRHTADFLIDHGVTDVFAVGPSAGHAATMLGSSCHVNGSFWYCDTDSFSGEEMAAIGDGDPWLIASAVCLPLFPLERHLEEGGGLIVSGNNGSGWTGWALVAPEDLAQLPDVFDRGAMSLHLDGLLKYCRIIADSEFRCGNVEELWESHKQAQLSNLSTIHHDGLEVKPGVWMCRNASVASGAKITAPAYIGENSLIGAGASIGPFAVIGRDCLISPNTTVRNALIAPGTYAGDNLDLDHVLADKGQLFDIRLGVAIDRVDAPILDDVFDFHWTSIPRQIGGVMASAVILGFAMMPLLLSSAWSRLRRECLPGRDTQLRQRSLAARSRH